MHTCNICKTSDDIINSVGGLITNTNIYISCIMYHVSCIMHVWYDQPYWWSNHQHQYLYLTYLLPCLPVTYPHFVLINVNLYLKWNMHGRKLRPAKLLLPIALLLFLLPLYPIEP